jgi:hypothetical protein
MSTIGQTVSVGGSTVEIRTTPEQQMQIQPNTHSNITGSEGVAAHIVEGNEGSGYPRLVDPAPRVSASSEKCVPICETGARRLLPHGGRS